VEASPGETHDSHVRSIPNLGVDVSSVRRRQGRYALFVFHCTPYTPDLAHAGSITYEEFEGRIKKMWDPAHYIGWEARVLFNSGTCDALSHPSFTGSLRSSCEQSAAQGPAQLTSRRWLVCSSPTRKHWYVAWPAVHWNAVRHPALVQPGFLYKMDGTAVPNPGTTAAEEQQIKTTEKRISEIKERLIQKVQQKQKMTKAFRKDTKYLLQTFRHFDANMNGVLSYGEVREALGPKNLNLGLSDQEVLDLCLVRVNICGAAGCDSCGACFTMHTCGSTPTRRTQGPFRTRISLQPSPQWGSTATTTRSKWFVPRELHLRVQESNTLCQ